MLFLITAVPAAAGGLASRDQKLGYRAPSGFLSLLLGDSKRAPRKGTAFNPSGSFLDYVMFILPRGAVERTGCFARARLKSFPGCSAGDAVRSRRIHAVQEFCR